MKIGFDTAKLSPTTIGGYITGIGAALLVGWKTLLPATIPEPAWCLTVGGIATLLGPIIIGHGAADTKDVQAITPPAPPAVVQAAPPKVAA